MKICKCFRTKDWLHSIGVGVCFGTREVDICKCGGDETKCDFYLEKRNKAIKKNTKYCENITQNNLLDEFICSKCGFMTDDFSEKRVDIDDCEVFHCEYKIKYCPNCGAKVRYDN